MQLPDEAIEAAAESWYLNDFAGKYPYPFGRDKMQANRYRLKARAALEEAAPFIAAQARATAIAECQDAVNARLGVDATFTDLLESRNV